MKLNSFVTVADATKVKVYMKNFGEFYNNQIESAGTIILSRTQKLTQEKLEAAVALLREKNPDAAILTTPWDDLDGKIILSAMEKVSLADELLAKMREEHEAEEAEHAHPDFIFLLDPGGLPAICTALCAGQSHSDGYRPGTPFP